MSSNNNLNLNYLRLQLKENSHTSQNMEEALGMMDEGYFVSRNEILTWLNNLLQLNLTKIEQLGTGAVYCQLLDILYPGKVPMSKVNWKAKLEYEFIQNLKILQSCFINLKIGRMIEIEKLSKAKYQDNLEFIQWFKRFFEMRSALRNEAYDPVARRNNLSLELIGKEKNKEKSNQKLKPFEKKENNLASANKNKNKIKNEPELNKKESNEKRVLDKIYQILNDSSMGEQKKLSEIYEILGVKSMGKENSRPLDSNIQMEEELI